MYRLFIIIFLGLLSCDSQNQRRTTFLEYVPGQTFSEDIAPIIHVNCTKCHRPGQAGPFQLITHEDVLKKAKTISEVVSNRYMPPWPADPNYRHFLQENYLSDQEINQITSWVKDDCPLGDSSFNTIPEFPDKSFLGSPDFSIKMKEPVILPGNNTDQFRLIKIPFELPKDTFVRAFEFVPDNRKLAHHMNGHLINYNPSLKKDHYGGKYAVDPEGENALRSYLIMEIENDDGTFPPLVPSVVNYLPGVLPMSYPEGIGGFYVSRKATFFMKTMHYGPTPVDATDQSSINFFFTDRKPERPVLEHQLGSLGLGKITPDFVLHPDSIQQFEVRWTCPETISMLTVIPHMHLLGKDYISYAITLKKDTIPLVKIDRWDFRWQFYYTFEKMMKIPAGSEIIARATFDNTSDNPNQPFNKPRRIVEPIDDMKTTDEMFQLIFTYLPYMEGDENISLHAKE